MKKRTQSIRNLQRQLGNKEEQKKKTSSAVALIESLTQIPEIKELHNILHERVSSLPFSFLPFLLAAVSENFSSAQTSLLFLPNEKNASNVYTELRYLASLFGKENNILFFPSWGILPYTHSHPDSEREGFRVQSLCLLAQHFEQKNKEGMIIVSSADAIVHPLLERNALANASLTLSSLEDTTTMKEVMVYLTAHGYEHVEIVEQPGDFSVKGSLLDVFCPAYFNPLRVDFFGEQVDSMRFFDPLTQRSLEKVSTFKLFPRRDIFLPQGNSATAWKNISEKFLGDFIAAKKHYANIPFLSDPEISLDGLWDIYPDLFSTESFFDYLPQDTNIFLFDDSNFYERIQNVNQESEFLYNKGQTEIAKNDSQKVFGSEPHKRFFNETQIEKFMEKFSITQLSITPKTLQDHSLHIQPSPAFKGKISSLHEYALEHSEKKVFLCATGDASLQRLLHILQPYQKEGFHPQTFFAPFVSGFEWQGGIFLTEKDIYGKSARSLSIAKSSSKAIESFVDLKEKDYVVHVNYGIGKFIRLKRMTVAGHERDFLELEYADSDKLYVPLEQINLVHRYIGSSDNPRLDFLGKKSSWEKVKNRVLASVEKMAEELLELYAKREKSHGFLFPPDTTFQEEFEALFPYEETDHQLLAITEVKKDMESQRAMDRLVCGDVGFGKTEVAIRAAFKAVMAGKQVALLCPTTVLAFQHHNTFVERFKNYPVQIDFISRFKTAAQVSSLRKKVKAGAIDIIIGTHSLLSEKNKFKNLGLLIIDEEQRFGVTHKEAIKKIRHNIDCLTMTATPIPRTLQLSLTGIRDLSLIETPPRNRKKIETYVVEENDQILQTALQFELDRQGQVYVLHNKVKTIEAQANRLRELMPNARIAILHGQLADEEIENVMLDFYRYKYDILLSTTIIESGIDIPLVNTLIVMNAQNFGLSQLYQIKGRVGRSERQAFSYFFYPKEISLNEIAQKRLNTLQEYDGLGAGFKIAMKDLEIRGAGNILGSEQSGDIVDVGFELYIQMLNDKMDEMRDQERDDFSATIIIGQNFYLPESYIPDTKQKIEVYKKMASSTDMQNLEAVREEVEDRFGQMPAQVEGMWFSEAIRILANNIKMDKIEMKEKYFSIYAGPQTKLATERVGRLIQNDSRFKISADDAKRLLFYPSGKKLAEKLSEFKKILEYLK